MDSTATPAKPELSALIDLLAARSPRRGATLAQLDLSDLITILTRIDALDLDDEKTRRIHAVYVSAIEQECPEAGQAADDLFERGGETPVDDVEHARVVLAAARAALAAR